MIKKWFSFFNAYDNSLDAFVPEFWAREGLMVLEEELVAAQLVYRDFENQIAAYGDVVNTRLPADFAAKRKTVADEVTVQDANATNVPVTLNQHIHVSFMIKDGEESLSMQDLISEYMRPAMRANGNIVDQIVLAQFTQFLNQGQGSLGALSSTTAKDEFLGIRKQFNQRSVPRENRNLILTVNSETEVLKTDLFLQAQQVGDDGTAIREASLGRKFGLNTFSSVFAPSVLEAGTVAGTIPTFDINNSSGYPVGYSGAMVIDGVTGTLVVGTFIKLQGVPYRIKATTATLGNATGVTLDRPLINAVANNAQAKIYKATVTGGTSYAVGYAKDITIVTGVTPQVGQMVSFEPTTVTYGTNRPGNPTGAPIYTVIQTNGDTTILLDRPLEVAVGTGTLCAVGPGGDYNFAFMRNAIALVSRPFAPPKAGTGALSAVANYNNLSMRATITYDGRKQGHLVTLDMLLGIKVLDTYQGVVLFG